MDGSGSWDDHKDGALWLVLKRPLCSHNNQITVMVTYGENRIEALAALKMARR